MVKTGNPTPLSTSTLIECSIDGDIVGRRSGADLQHPRRSLGERHRAQAEKFLRNAEKDKDKKIQCLNWAEQSSRQSVLYDCLLYTSPSPRDVEESRMPSSA